MLTLGENGRERPNDTREFFHKSFIGKALGGVVKTLIPGASTAISIAETILPRRTPRTTIPTTVIPETFAPTRDITGRIPGDISMFPLPIHGNGPSGNGAAACNPPMIWDDARGFCVAPTSPLGAATFGGDAVMGRFGPAQVPGSRVVDVATCGTGMALGKDGLCYDHLPNRDRKYPRGRRPLLTGGDMRAISRARRAGNRLANTKNDLVAIGMLKPAPSKRRKKRGVPTC